MKATRMRRASALASLASVVFLFATIALPYVKLPESAEQTVAQVTVDPPAYQVFGYGIPPVSAGSHVTVTLTGYTPFKVQYSLSPTAGNILLPALASGRAGNGSAVTFIVSAANDYALELTLIAYNGSGFTVRYSGVWSPFNDFNVYTAPAFFLLTASLAATYYFGTRIGKQLNEEQVERELRESASGRSQNDN